MAEISKQSLMEIDILIDECRYRRKQRLEWFQNERGVNLRTKVPNRKSYRAHKRGRCAMCNVNNSHNKVGVKPATKCETCNVYLCLLSRHRCVSCWDEQHSNADIFQRINSLPAPRRNMRKQLYCSWTHLHSFFSSCCTAFLISLVVVMIPYMSSFTTSSRSDWKTRISNTCSEIEEVLFSCFKECRSLVSNFRYGMVFEGIWIEKGLDSITQNKQVVGSERPQRNGGIWVVYFFISRITDHDWYVSINYDGFPNGKWSIFFKFTWTVLFTIRSYEQLLVPLSDGNNSPLS